MKTVIVFTFLSLLVCAASVWPQGETQPLERNTIFFRANDYYSKEEYAAAIKDYEQLVNAGIRSANIYYNLGNSYLKTGNKGRAILYYERAFKMRPRDANIRANLDHARSLVEDSTQQSSEKWYRRAFLFHGFLSVDGMTILAFILYLVAIILVSLSVLFRIWEKIFRYSAIVCGFLLIMVLPSLINGIYESEVQKKAVISVEERAARFEPTEDATVHFKLYEGTVIQITRSQGDWHQVKRGDGKMGWLRSGAFIII